MPRTKRVDRRGLGGRFAEKRARSSPRSGPPPPFTPRAEEGDGDGDGDGDLKKGKAVVVEVKGKSEQFVPQKLSKVAHRKAFKLLGYKQTYLRPKCEPRSIVGAPNMPRGMFGQYGGLVLRQTGNLDVPSLGVKEPILELGAEFPLDSYNIQTKVKILSEHFSSFRTARKDGNCFYRCFIFAYLELVYEAQDEDEVNHILACLQKFQEDYVSLGGNKAYLSDLIEALGDMVREIPEGREINMIYTAEDLYEKFQDENEMSFILSLLRLIASVEICKNKEIYSLYLGQLKDRTAQEICEELVVPLGVEAEQMQVLALSNALRVPVKVLIINSSTSPRGTTKLNYRSYYPRPIYNSGQGSSSSRRNRHAYAVTLAYRPGQYDILYHKK